MPVTNPISVGANTNYGGPEGYNKYSPLKPINLVAADEADYTFLVDNRKDLLSAYGAFPAELTLTVSDWAATIASETAGPKHPPLVVVSSNSSNYIKTGLQTVDAQLAAQPGPPIAHFNNISDLRAFAPPPRPSPPIYCPKRLDPAYPRNVYVVVQYNEYATYRAAVAGHAGIHIVGFDFKKPALAPGILTGFGAARYAAIEFCKQLRTQAGNPWAAAWLFDDNVVGLDKFKGLNAVEAALGGAICAGFKGLSQPQNRVNTQAWINGVPATHREGLNLPPLPAPKNNGLVQQAACWNIAQLQAHNLNFSPIFVASKEDVSFTNYFDASPLAYQFYATKTIRKETRPSYDNSDGAKAVNEGRTRYTDVFAYIESDTPVKPPNPAVATTLRPYINATVVPGAAAVAGGGVPAEKKAACQAVESIATRAINGSYRPPPPPRPAGYLGWVTQANLDAIFRPASVGGAYSAALTVTRRDVP